RHFISPGERPAAATRFLTFLCDKSFLPPGTTAPDLDKHLQRNNLIEFAILGENRLRVWLAENPENRNAFWNALMPGKLLPSADTRKRLIELVSDSVTSDNNALEIAKQLQRQRGTTKLPDLASKWLEQNG